MVNDDAVKVMGTYRRLVEGSTEENGLMLGMIIIVTQRAGDSLGDIYG